VATLRSWASADPAIAAAVEARKVDLPLGHPGQRITLALLEERDLSVLQAEWEARHPASVEPSPTT